jgi:hypothetical protein
MPATTTLTRSAAEAIIVEATGVSRRSLRQLSAAEIVAQAEAILRPAPVVEPLRVPRENLPRYAPTHELAVKTATDYEVGTATRMYAAGHSFTDIAKALGCCRNLAKKFVGMGATPVSTPDSAAV